MTQPTQPTPTPDQTPAADTAATATSAPSGRRRLGLVAGLALLLTGGAFTVSAMASDTGPSYVTVIDDQGNPVEAPTELDTTAEDAAATEDGRDCPEKSGGQGPEQGGSTSPAPAPEAAPQQDAPIDGSEL